MLLNEILQYSSRFVPPTNDSEEYDEVVYQLEQDQQDPFLPNWVRLALTNMQHEKMFRLMNRRNGDVLQITPSEQLNIGNTGDSWEDSHWKPESVARVADMYKTNQSITMPTLLMNKQTGEKWLLGGHHRLTYNAQQLKKNTPCWVIKV